MYNNVIKLYLRTDYIFKLKKSDVLSYFAFLINLFKTEFEAIYLVLDNENYFMQI